jgi:hypothetical protein
MANSSFDEFFWQSKTFPYSPLPSSFNKVKSSNDNLSFSDLFLQYMRLELPLAFKLLLFLLN